VVRACGWGEEREDGGEVRECGGREGGEGWGLGAEEMEDTWSGG